MSQVEVNTNTNSVNVQNLINTIDVNQDSNIVVVPQQITSVVEVITAGPQGPKGEPGDPSLFTSSFVGTGSFFAFTASMYSFTASYYLDSASFSASIAELQDYSTSFDHSIIYSGSVSAQVNVDGNLFLIKSGSNPYFNIKNTSETTIYSNLFIVRNFTTQNPVLTVTESIVRIATHSFNPTDPTVAGSIWFTSSSFYVGLE
jgi:hypothetical protein